MTRRVLLTLCVLCAGLQAKDVHVQGTVSCQDGGSVPVRNVVVQIRNSNQVKITDINGWFQMTLQQRDIFDKKLTLRFHSALDTMLYGSCYINPARVNYGVEPPYFVFDDCRIGEACSSVRWSLAEALELQDSLRGRPQPTVHWSGERRRSRCTR